MMDLDIVTDKLFTNLNSLQFQELHILTLKTAFYKKSFVTAEKEGVYITTQ